MELDYEKSIEIDLDKSICELRQVTLDNSVDTEELSGKAYLISIPKKTKQY